MGDTDLLTIVERLRPVTWKWDKSGLDAIAAAIGLTEREPHSNRVRFHLPGTSLRPSYIARGELVRRFDAFCASFDVGDFANDSNFQDILEEQYEIFRKKFEKAARQIARQLGPPAFQGGPDDAGYETLQPDLLGAMHVALWPVNNGRLVLMCDHQDKELPITLELLVVPPEPA